MILQQLKKRFLILASMIGWSAMTGHAMEEWAFFEQSVRPILEKHCAECHSGEKRKGGFSLNTRESILSGSEIDDVVIPGNPQKSLFVELIEEPDPEFRMPPEDKEPLSNSEITTIKKWIENGVAWPDGFTLGKVSKRAPLQLKEVKLPLSTDESHPVDQILISYLSQNAFTMNDRMPWSRWLRKASLDVTGLLPSSSLFEKYNHLSWDSADDYISELLEMNEAYAGHWLGYWNDWLRNDYKGTGFIDGGRKQITKWLFEALYTNKPYNSFVKGLLTAEPGAEGFLHGIKWRGTVNDSQRREMQSAQSISQIFLGTNLKCASCHDSFINDWKLKEAYAFASVFADKPLELHRCDKPLGKTIDPGFLYPELGKIDAQLNRSERLTQLAALVTKPENGRFTRTIVNRLWAHFMGEGIIPNVDDMDQDAFSDSLLDWLAQDLINQKYDLKSTIRTITTSRAYQCAPSNEIETFGPSTKRMSAEQFLDAVSYVLREPLKYDNASMRRDGRGQGGQLKEIGTVLARRSKKKTAPQYDTSKAKWVWQTKNAAQSAPAGDEIHISKTFELDKKPIKASLTASADNEVTIIINGKKVGSSNNWNVPMKVDTTKHLKAGKNTIELKAKNGGGSPNPAGAILALSVMQSSSQSPITIVTDKSWKLIGSDKNAYAVELGNVNMSPWTIQGAFNQQPDWITPKLVRASYLFADNLTRAMGRPPREQIVTRRDPYASTLELLELSNGSLLDQQLTLGSANWQNQFKASKTSAISQVFVKALSRKPNKRELSICLDMLGDSPTKENIQDFFWTIIMQPEFQLID